MSGTLMTEAPHNTRKAVLEYLALASIAVLALVIYLWLSFFPPSKEEERAAPWDFRLTSVIELEEEDLTAIRALNTVGRVEKSGNTELYLWLSDTAADRTAYEKAVDAAEEEINALANERESARIEKLLREFDAEPDAAALAELAAMQQELDAEAERLLSVRQKLDREQDALQQRQEQLNAVRTELNQNGHALDEAEASINAGNADANRDELRRQSEKRDAWYAGGEDYLDSFTAFEQDRASLDMAERDYAAALSAWNEKNQHIEQIRRNLETLPEPPVIEDCTWRVERNLSAAEVFDTQEEAPFSPLRLAMQMLFLGISAMAAWLFFARLLSSAAGTITKPKPASAYSGPAEESAFLDTENEAAAAKERT